MTLSTPLDDMIMRANIEQLRNISVQLGITEHIKLRDESKAELVNCGIQLISEINLDEPLDIDSYTRIHLLSLTAYLQHICRHMVKLGGELRTEQSTALQHIQATLLYELTTF